MQVEAVAKEWADRRYEVIGVSKSGNTYSFVRGNRIKQIYLPSTLQLTDAKLMEFLDRVLDNVRVAM